MSLQSLATDIEVVFSFLFFFFSQFELRIVRTSSHQKGSMWTILKNAWTCARWSAFIESQVVRFKCRWKQTMTSVQALNPLGQCEWLLFHYSPAKEELSFIPPYLNCEVQNFFNYNIGRLRKYPHFHKLPYLILRCSFAYPAVCSGRCQLGTVCEHLW